MNLTIKRAATIIAFVAAALATTAANAAVRDFRVNGYATKVFTYRADPGELFRVEVRGDGDTDLDLFIHDDDGHLVCSRTAASDREICIIRARFGGVYRIKVENLGRVYNEATLTVD